MVAESLASTTSGSRPTEPNQPTTSPTSDVIPVTTDAAGRIVVDRRRLMYASLPFFMAQLRDEADNPLIVDEHHEEWCSLLVANPLCCLLAPRDHGKMIDVDEVLPTPDGWKRMGDLADGDVVFDERGCPTTVTKAHPITTDAETFVVRFDDGSEITACGDHLWTTWDHYARRRAADLARSGHRYPNARPEADRRPQNRTHLNAGPRTLTTKEIAATLRVNGERNHAVVVTRPLQLAERDLPVDPYLLGCWLGDGTTTAAQITSADPEIVAAFVAQGYVLIPSASSASRAAPSYRIQSAADTRQRNAFGRALRSLGVLGNKHIPEAYLWASEAQRRALLAGLMDTDGFANGSGSDGTVEFTNTKRVLAQGVFEIAASLGFKPRMIEGRATLAGVDHGPKWRVYWTPRTQVFRLTRKAAILEPRLERPRQQPNRTTYRFIESVTPVASKPMRCITVDSPSRLYLVGRSMIPTHNSWTVISYLLWLAWRHNRDPETFELYRDDEGELSSPDGKLDVLYFSDIVQQSGERMDTLRSLLTAEGNRDIFGDILPDFRRGRTAAIRGVWAQRRVRLKNGFEVVARGFRTSTRGIHPKIIVLDDVLNDTNTLTSYQRNKTWRYLQGTVMPMSAQQVIVIGTAFHYDDLLHRLKPDRRKAPLVVNGRKVYFVWRKYRSVNWDTGAVLWPERHDIDDLSGRRDADPLLFSREFQNDPRDDASSIFPEHLTKPAITAGSELHFAAPVMKPGDYFNLPPDLRPPVYVKDLFEFLVLSSDMALGSEADNDYCVVNVGSYNIRTQERKLIWALRSRGWDLNEQVRALRMACSIFPIDLGCIEHNSFQRWVRTETLRYPETAGRIVGHNTGPERQTLQEGVPSLVIGLAQRLWTIASGDKPALRYAGVWQTELNAFGWKDDKLQGVGEHDDTVMAFWLLERAVRLINTLLQQGPKEQYVGLDDVGIERIDPSSWDQPLAYQR